MNIPHCRLFRRRLAFERAYYPGRRKWHQSLFAGGRDHYDHQFDETELLAKLLFPSLLFPGFARTLANHSLRLSIVKLPILI
jgi:hypothetical protein